MTERELSRWKEIRSRSIFRYVILRGIILGLILIVVLYIFMEIYFFIFKDIIKYFSIGIAIFLLNWIVNEKRYIKHFKKTKNIEFKNKGKILIIAIGLILVMIIEIKSYINKREELANTMKAYEVKEAIELDLSEFDYRDYLSLKMYESELLFNATTPERKKDDKFNNIPELFTTI